MKLLNFLSNRAHNLIGFKVLFTNFIHETKLFTPSKFQIFNRIQQFADPFLMVYNEKLYCFFEEKVNNLNGRIKVAYYNDTETWNIEYIDLGLNGHISFPFIVSHESEVFMLPETAQINEVALYQSFEFPLNWKKHKVLLKGNFVDSHIFVFDGIYYLFTTKKILVNENSSKYDYQLELFFSDNLDGDYVEHPKSPILRGREFGRSAGSIVNLDGKLLRPSQDCSQIYGDDIHLFEILTISKLDYKEKLYCRNYIRTQFGEKLGGHHISQCYYKNQLITAYDFNFKQSYFQRFINKLIP